MRQKVQDLQWNLWFRTDSRFHHSHSIFFSFFFFLLVRLSYVESTHPVPIISGLCSPSGSAPRAHSLAHAALPFASCSQPAQGFLMHGICPGKTLQMINYFPGSLLTQGLNSGPARPILYSRLQWCCLIKFSSGWLLSGPDAGPPFTEL